MITLIQTEFIKLKHSKIFLLTVLGALSIPALLYIALLTGEYATFQGLLDYCTTYACALFYIIIFTIIIAYLFGREYTEHTLKTVLTAPLSKTTAVWKISDVFHMDIYNHYNYIYRHCTCCILRRNFRYYTVCWIK